MVDATGTALEVLVKSICCRENNSGGKTKAELKVILAPHDGYLCRSDILNLRMKHSEYVDAVVSFGSWNKRLSAFFKHEANDLLSLLLSSPGALLMKPTTKPCDDESLELQRKDLNFRLSFDWILKRKPAAYKVALVGGRHLFDSKRVTFRAEGFVEAARALGISLAVIDQPGHWLEGEHYAHLRGDFIAVDLSYTESLPERIAKSVKNLGIDGITTFTDEFVLATAEAAELLGLATEPVQVLAQAHCKHELRKVLSDTEIQTMFLHNSAELDDPALADQLNTLVYPLMIKPSSGRSSAGVKKAIDNSSMREAVRMLDAEDLAGDGIVLETFVHGPELDCNFVLHDGEVLFLEVTDDLPATGDASNATLADNFFETVSVSNSGLPLEEIDILSSSLHGDVLRLGLQWGVVHAEARIQHSTMQYQDTQEDGIMDLVTCSTKDHAIAEETLRPRAFLIEANIRPPGAGCAMLTRFTYGIDYDALHMLRAVEDRDRFEALSVPFVFPRSAGGGGGAQYWAAHCTIPIHRENIRVPVDLLEKIFRLLPGVAPYVFKAELYVKPGSVVSPHGGVGLIAYVLLNSKTSRRHVLSMYHELVKVAKQVLDA
ncbi:MAG: hypothetical protein M1828_001449 [Chrysothrix sp. TS-e1954]|nr:MAG: hypothetical protein M1828_001449 [Chrysothrix sp. TS-e1954]